MSLGETGSLPQVHFPLLTITNIFQNLLDKWGVVSRFPEQHIFCCTSLMMSCTITLATTGILHDYRIIHLWDYMCLRMFLIHLCTEKVCHMKKDTQHFSPYKENFFSKEHSNCDTFHLTASSHTAQQSVKNCVLPCANLHVITLYQS